MAMPTPHRRAFSQIQNTITKPTAIVSKNATRDDGVSAVKRTEKENADQVSVARKDTAIEKSTKKLEKQKEEVDREKRYDVPGENFDYLKDLDYDAPVETCPQNSNHSFGLDLDDVLPPEERLSRLDPRLWNRLLTPSVDFDKKENILEDLYANLSDGCDLEEIENGLASLDLQKLPLHK